MRGTISQDRRQAMAVWQKRTLYSDLSNLSSQLLKRSHEGSKRKPLRGYCPRGAGEAVGCQREDQTQAVPPIQEVQDSIQCQLAYNITLRPSQRTLH
jgi:hypothetical protein